MSEQQSNVEPRDFEKEFSDERANWTEKIRTYSVRMKNIREVAEVQVDLYTSRQVLLEYQSKLAQAMIKLNSKFRKDKGDRLKFYSENTQVKYGANEKTPLIEADLSMLKERMDIVEGQITYIQDTVKTVDHMLYGIRSRITLEEYMRNGSVKKDY
jgi:hypothetical protein